MKKNIVKVVCVVGALFVLLTGLNVRIVTNVYKEYKTCHHMKADTWELRNLHVEQNTNNSEQAIYIPKQGKIKVWLAW